MKQPARIEYDAQGQARSFTGREAVDVFAMAALASALRMYARCGMKASRFHTPANMMAAAAQHTGLKFKARDYLAAADALAARVQSEKTRLADAAAAHDASAAIAKAAS